MNDKIDSKIETSADPYEQEYMTEGAILERQKMVAPWFFHAIMGFSVLAVIAQTIFVLVATGMVGPWFVPLLVLPVLMAAWAMFSALRVTVTTDHAHVQYGIFGPKIPIESIEHCEAEDYSVWKYGGYGIRYSVIDGAWCYNMLGDKGRAARIHYRTSSGKLRKLLVASHHPEVLANSINRARAAKGLDVSDALGVSEHLESAIEEAAENKATEASSAEEIVEEVTETAEETVNT